MASGMLEKSSGCAPFSAKYISDDAMNSRIDRTSSTVSSSDRLACTTLDRVRNPEKYLPSRASRARRRTARSRRRSTFCRLGKSAT